MVSAVSEPRLEEDKLRRSTNEGAPSISSALSNGGNDSHLPADSRTPEEDNRQDMFPEGGARAWLSVLGSFCGMMCCFGLMNTIGTFQAYIVQDQLSSYSAADVGWIFGLYLFVAYFSGIQTGPLFDAKGPKLLMVAGSTCLVATMFFLSVCNG